MVLPTGLAGKVAFITGGASGIGLGMAAAFVEAGVKVVLADVNADGLEHAKSKVLKHATAVHTICIDVTNRPAMADAVEETTRQYGAVHILCNNAGANLFVPTDEARYEDYDWVLGVNLGGVINGVVSFLPAMKKHGEPSHIVNTASIGAYIPSRFGVYTASKCAVAGLTEGLRLSLAESNIGVSLLCPGLVASEIVANSESSAPSAAKLPADEARRINDAHQLGMSPIEVGRHVVRGILANQPFIFTHPEFQEELAARFQSILGSQPTDAVPKKRLESWNRQREALHRQEARASRTRF